MTTKFVGIKEFRQNIAKFEKQARRKKQRIIVTRNDKPVFEVTPLSDENIYSDAFIKGIEKAEADIRAGRFVTLEELEHKYGL